MVKKNEIAYVPIAPVEKAQVQAPEKIEEPQYPDKGVSYGGYSKTLFTGNQYRLSKQDYVDNNTSITFAALATGVSITNPGGGNKDFYCNKMIITSQKSGAIANIDEVSVRDGLNNIRLRLRELTINNVLLNFDFVVPLFFSKSNPITVVYTQARAAGDILAVNLFGWIED
jgi:hypothetical protein